MVESPSADTTNAVVPGPTETSLSSPDQDKTVHDQHTSKPADSATMTNPGPLQTLWILIFKGQPKDIQSTRTTELYIAFDEDESTNVTIQMQGEHPNFRINELWNQALPWTRPNFYRRLAVSTFATVGNGLDMRVRDAIWSTPVSNVEQDYSSQTWIGDVVTVLQEANLITAEEGDNALNGMVNYISQAPWR